MLRYPFFMSEILVDQIQGPAAEAQFSVLEDAAFGVQAPGRYLDDFPIWDNSLTHAVGTTFRLGAFAGERLIAAAGVRIAELKNSQGPLTAALIGAVATDSEYRGRGLATQLVSLAVEWAGERGAALAMLWGSEHQLYGRIGFAPCGTQASIPLDTLAGGADAKTRISEGWTPGILKALKSRPQGIAIRDIDRAWLGAHKNVRWFWTGSPEQVGAYAALGRGIDLSHFVHEWGGTRGDLLAVLQRIHEVDPDAKLLGSPELFKKYGFLHDPSLEERLGLARVIDATKLFKSVHPDVPFTAAFVKGEWKLSLVGKDGRTVSCSLPPLEAAQLFFGPVPAGVLKPWSDYFPLPLWFWGLDAV